jgi:hypothetical protein
MENKTWCIYKGRAPNEEALARARVSFGGHVVVTST